jgi:hypothetical protein
MAVEYPPLAFEDGKSQNAVSAVKIRNQLRNVRWSISERKE